MIPGFHFSNSARGGGSTVRGVFQSNFERVGIKNTKKWTVLLKYLYIPADTLLKKTKPR